MLLETHSSFSLQFVIVVSYVIIVALIMGRKNKRIVDKLLMMPVEEDRDYETYLDILKGESRANYTTAKLAPIILTIAWLTINSRFWIF
jgi:hypothetical protein